MSRIAAPFTPEQVEQLNLFQQAGRFHPFTCYSSGPPDRCERRLQKSDGELTATLEGWVCACGFYTQQWAHDFMAQPSSASTVVFQTGQDD